MKIAEWIADCYRLFGIGGVIAAIFHHSMVGAQFIRWEYHQKTLYLPIRSAQSLVPE